MVLQKAMKQGRNVHGICSDHKKTSRMCGHVGHGGMPTLSLRSAQAIPPLFLIECGAVVGNVFLLVHFIFYAINSCKSLCPLLVLRRADFILCKPNCTCS